MEQTPVLVRVRIGTTDHTVEVVKVPHGWTLRHPGPCGAAHCTERQCTFAEYHTSGSFDGWHYLPGCTGRLTPYLHAIVLAAAAGEGEVK